MERGFSLLDLGSNYHRRSLLVQDGGDEMVKVPLVAVVARVRDLVVLFDTGPDVSKGYPIMKQLNTTQSQSQRLESQLSLLSLRPEDVDVVVVSHLHYDHAGGIAKFKNVPVLIQGPELDYAYRPDWFYEGTYCRPDFDLPDVDFERLSGDYEIDYGLRVISIPGHTPGTQGLYVETESGSRVIFVSDAIYTRDNFQPVKRKQGLDWNTATWGSSVDKVKLMARLRKAEIYPGHDPAFYAEKKFSPFVYK
ncbi:hypothetical protein HS1genome_1991 [Sulfodiicoccus acidiphilus]|uniref:Metallo-beta-lactamase domain-containing protein n=1 Tax=Sulfodiicoccus acidiphilus TaxID=1670455 RepID=A0A348B600_9CREN|nr:N-acyl homoserine lactonase family protein [Sulfodiicoccus acidiphilus]BBD73602.1 hypothetical protein HS1genome_1991 [Sulfodiicoccus acidiphilus]GGU01559.1 hypothetical protein GCM10007116_18410 [Sulfodiicoccus acidiphilus]